MFIASPTGILEYDVPCDVYSWIAVILFHSCALLFVSFFTFYWTQSCMATNWYTGYIKIDCNRTKSRKSSLVTMNQLTKLNTSFLPCHRIFDIVLWCCIKLSFFYWLLVNHPIFYFLFSLQPCLHHRYHTNLWLLLCLFCKYQVWTYNISTSLKFMFREIKSQCLQNNNRLD